MPYTAVQAMLNGAAVPGRRYYMCSNYLDELSDGGLEVFGAGFAKVPSANTGIVFVSMGGAVSRVAPEATAYVRRGAAYTTTVIGGWLAPQDDEANVAGLRALWKDLQPHLPNRVYVNELQDEGPDRIRAAYGPSYERLVALKRKYDPTNRFRLNQNIPPA